jgi:hypothetical protein
MQEIRRFKPSTVSRRMAVVTGFYRTCVIDGVVEHSPTDYVRLPWCQPSHYRRSHHFALQPPAVAAPDPLT